MTDKCPYCDGTGIAQPKFCSRLLIERQRKGVSQEELANAIGVSRAQVANLERGRGEPSVGALMRAARYFECSVDRLLGMDASPSQSSREG